MNKSMISNTGVHLYGLNLNPKPEPENRKEFNNKTYFDKHINTRIIKK